MGTDNKTEAQVAQASTELKSVDDAWSYLHRHDHDSTEAGSVDLRALRRKIDWRIVPLMFGCYTMQFLDKVILNVSRQYQTRLHDRC